MKKTPLLLLGSALLFCVTLPLHALQVQQPGGCVNSPENPTAILAVVASAGAFLFQRFRSK